MSGDTRFESQYPQGAMQDQIAKCAGFIKEGKSIQIVGLPGTGKSTLLKLLAYNASIRKKHFISVDTFHFVYLDFSEMKSRPLSDVIKFMLVSLSYSLSERGLSKESTSVNALLKEAAAQDEIILFQSLKKAIDLLVAQNLTLIFLFDRFDAYLPSVTEHFFIDLNVLRHRAKYKFSCLFSLPRPLDSLIEPEMFAEFYEHLAGNTVFVPLSDPVGLAFRISYLEKIARKKLTDKTRESLSKLTGGYNRLSVIGYEALLSENDTVNIEEFLLARRQVRSVLYELWEYLTPHEKAHLKNMQSHELAGDEDVLFLEHVELLSKNGKIQIPLFQRYIDSLKSSLTDKLVFNSETNEIYKGEEDLTRLLSPSEFRLLRHLIQNKGKVIEKNEIIEAVWRDTKTQEGVTDQALDQIIYRIRKKIEPEPNNPKYILTIKGKGIQYSE